MLLEGSFGYMEAKLLFESLVVVPEDFSHAFEMTSKRIAVDDRIRRKYIVTIPSFDSS
jgi:hypothetical protein